MFDTKTLQQYYNGFFIQEPVGNNAFSFAQRHNRKIFVPSIINGSLDDLAIGHEIAFSEMEEGREVNYKGLKSFIYIHEQNKDIFIFDNHNHAFFFWVYAYQLGKLKPQSTLVHVDQHKDTRQPQEKFGKSDLKEAFKYTNFKLNVGNFIPPAVSLGLFSKVIIIDSETAFNQALPSEFVLDIDMDVFSPEMDYIKSSYKLERIQSYIKQSNLITVATSPYFMDQDQAISLVKELFKGLS